MPYEKIITVNLVKFRELRGLEQQELAEKLGISKQALNNYEKGRRPIPSHLVPHIADILNVSIDSLYGRDARG